MNEIEIPFMRQIYLTMNTNSDMDNYMKFIERNHNSIIDERRNKLIDLMNSTPPDEYIELKNVGFLKYSKTLNLFNIYDLNDFYLIAKYNKYKPLIELDLSSIIDNNNVNDTVDFSVSEHLPFIVNKLNSRYKYQHSRDFDDVLKNPVILMNILNQTENVNNTMTKHQNYDLIILYDEYLKDDENKLYKRIKRTEEDIKYNPTNDEEYGKKYYHDMNKYYLLKYIHNSEYDKHKLQLFNMNTSMIKPMNFYAYRNHDME